MIFQYKYILTLKKTKLFSKLLQKRKTEKLFCYSEFPFKRQNEVANESQK